MVVLSAAVCTKGGKVLVARQFVPMPKTRIEGLLAAFPKLIGGDVEHTFVDTDAVRYVYQPMEQLYLLLITNKQSNIMEDLETLRLVAKIVPEYCGGQTEDAVVRRQFELVFALDEVISIGYKENVTLQQIKTFTEMDSHEEKLQKIIMESKMNEAKIEAARRAEALDKQKAEMKKLNMKAGGGAGGGYGGQGYGGGHGGGSSSSGYDDRDPTPAPSRTTPKAADETPKSKKAAPAATGPKPKGMQLGNKKKEQENFFAQIATEEKAVISKTAPAAAAQQEKKQNVSVILDEKLNIQLERDGGIKQVEIKGEIKLCIYDPDDAKIIVVTTGLDEAQGWKCRLHPKINKSLWSSDGRLGLSDATKSFPVGSDNAPIIVKWRKVSNSETDVPLTLNFWPSVENGQTVVSCEFAMEKEITFTDVSITIPCPSSEPPEVTNVDGEFKYDHKKKLLTWLIPEISPSHKSGTLEFSVPELDDSEFYPINVNLHSDQTYSGIQIVGVQEANSSDEKEFAATTTLGVEKYSVE